MFLEREIASIIRFTLDATGKPQAYYREMPESFYVPAVYFPVPEVSVKGWTLDSYALQYMWGVYFFASDERQAHELAFSLFIAITERRNLIPLVDKEGEITGRGVRLKDAELKRYDGNPGAAQVQLRWDSPRSYYREPERPAVSYRLKMYGKNAFDAAVETLKTEGNIL